MRGLITAICFFAAAVAGAVLIQITLEKTSGKVIKKIDVLTLTAENGEWEDADTAMTELETSLENTSKWIAMFIDHKEIDMIISCFSKLKEYEKYRELPELMGETSTLRELMGHIPKKEALSLENIL